MEELHLLKKLGSVKAPQDFEAQVSQRLSERRKHRQKVKHLRLSFAGAFSALLAVGLIVQFLILPQGSPVSQYGIAEKGKTPSSGLLQERFLAPEEAIPIMESVDYAREMHAVAYEPRTIYILENVSDESSPDIKY